jgi:hypothetical protein
MRPVKISSENEVWNGGAVAQAISRWLPTSAAWVQPKSDRGICDEQSRAGASFLRLLRFPLALISPAAPHSSSSVIIRGSTVRQIVADVRSGFILPLPQETITKVTKRSSEQSI